MSTNPSNGKISGRITKPMAGSDRTGTQPTATGSPRPSSFAGVMSGDPLLDLPASIRPIVSEPLARLITSLRFDPDQIDPEWCAPGIATLARHLDDFHRMSQPSTPADVGDMLELIASAVQVAVPEERGGAVYAALLQRLPAHVLRLAAMEILKTHRIRVLPLPAELLATEAVREWDILAECWPRLVLDWQRRLALAMPNPEPLRLKQGD
jgi:hypothetical protein